MDNKSTHWDSHDRHSMANFIRNSGMPLESHEKRLLHKLIDDQVYYNVSVYDLYEANGLCFMALGWLRAKNNV